MDGEQAIVAKARGVVVEMDASDTKAVASRAVCDGVAIPLANVVQPMTLICISLSVNAIA